MSENHETTIPDETQLSDATHLSSTPQPKHRATQTSPEDDAKTSTQDRHFAMPQLPERPGNKTTDPQPATAVLPEDIDATHLAAHHEPATETSSVTAPVLPGSAAPGAALPMAPSLPSPAPGAGLLPTPSPQIVEFQQAFNKLVANVSNVVVGKELPIKLCITALMVGGHVLLEDFPGTGKTQLARGLANSIQASFKRIQFTPDLLPSDVVGVTFYDQKAGEFEFRPGPIFASIVLADEINRASPKTQSALLEVMEEQKVTVDGQTRDVAQPFIVIATQNPIEQLGTYKLPEAQMDRFLIKTSVGYPGHDVSVGILKQVNVRDRAQTISPVLTGQQVLELRKTAEHVRVDDTILEYIVRLVEATRHSEKLVVGSSMRGALALTRCTRIWAAADGRAYVVPDDVKDLAAAVLTHRITLTPEATFAGETPEQVIAQLLEDVPAPTLGA